ncbi:MutS protein msh5 [Actinomortierella ambigua]|uniref:MutS protein msh5 n=1 Tax=Actinomortierella ambigua TaxID=1343610 RepID=A0A9P6Q834_9FUNG|nr:MutS protein msh5 [Actinomortierella ambigua]
MPASTTSLNGVSTTFDTSREIPHPSFMSHVDESSWMGADVGTTGGEGEVGSMRPDYGGETFIIMAIQMRGKGVGCAYYDDHSSKLWVLETLRECTSLDVLDMIKTQVCPTLILANSKMEEQALYALKADDIQQQTKVEIRPSNEFMYDMAKSKLLSLVLSQGFRRHASRSLNQDQREVESSGDIDPLVSAEDYRRRQGLIDLSNTIDLDNVDSIGCAGALLSYLSRTRPLHTASDMNRTIVLDIATFSLTRTPQGRNLLRQWFLRPSLDLNVIQSRQQSVECLVKPENQPAMDQMLRCLSRIKNIPRVLQAIHRKAMLKDWQGIIQFACYSLKIYSLCHELFEVETPIIHSIRNTFQVQELNEVGSLINDVVDFDESMIEGRCIVKPNVDEELDRMRQTYQGLDSFLSEVAKDISKTIPSHFASTINVVYFPQLGYLITVPMNPNWKKEDDFYLDGLSYQFSTERAVYYKNNATRDREIDILQTLQERVIEYSHLLVLCSDLCAELDAILSLAQAAKMQRYTRPIMSDQTILHIVNGRHPLQELCVESFVPNDTMIGEFHLDEVSGTTKGASSNRGTTTRSTSFCPHCPNAPATIDSNHVMILCGPNCSADHALIGLTDKILTRLQTRETVSKVHSTFMADLSQVSHAIRMATRRSLVVLDEFGKGTATTDGAGLFCGVIEHFAGLARDQRPRVLATTHFHELFENQLMRIGTSNGGLLSSEIGCHSRAVGQQTIISSETPAVVEPETSSSSSSSSWSVHGVGASFSQAAVPPSSTRPHSSNLSTDLPLPISVYTMEALFDDTLFAGSGSNPLSDTKEIRNSTLQQHEPTFLFRVRPGRYPLSLGTACAATSGLPAPVVQRSIYLSHLFRRYEMVVPDLSQRDEVRFEMYEQLFGRLLQLKFDSISHGQGDEEQQVQDDKGSKEVKGEKEEREIEEGKVDPELWADIVALLEYAGQVEAFEKDEA